MYDKNILAESEIKQKSISAKYKSDYRIRCFKCSKEEHTYVTEVELRKENKELAIIYRCFKCNWVGGYVFRLV